MIHGDICDVTFFPGNLMARALIIMDTFNFFLCWNLTDPGSNVFTPVYSGSVGEFTVSPGLLLQLCKIVSSIAKMRMLPSFILRHSPGK